MVFKRGTFLEYREMVHGFLSTTENGKGLGGIFDYFFVLGLDAAWHVHKPCSQTIVDRKEICATFSFTSLQIHLNKPSKRRHPCELFFKSLKTTYLVQYFIDLAKDTEIVCYLRDPSSKTCIEDIDSQRKVIDES